MYRFVEHIAALGYDPDEVLTFMKESIQDKRELKQIQSLYISESEQLEIEIRLTRMEKLIDKLECERDRNL